MKRPNIVAVPVVALIVLLIMVGCTPDMSIAVPLPETSTHNNNRDGQAKLAPENISRTTPFEAIEQTEPENVVETAVEVEVSADSSHITEEDSSLNPPAIGQGGTCITGSIIDVYHQPRSGSDWKIIIEKIGPDHQEPVTILPDSNGHFQYPLTDTELTAGTYQISLIYPEGWQPFTPDAFEVTLSGMGSECAQTRFKMEALANLEVIKLDNHGHMDFRDRIGIAGWEITLRDLDQDTDQTAVTDGEGKAYFHNLPPGEWTVVEEEKAGWQPIPGFPAERTITLVSPKDPGAYQTLVFINEQVHDGEIIVTKMDIWDQPLAGWPMTLTRPDGTQPMQTTVTGADGTASFKNLALGDWEVAEASQDWWQPVNDTPQSVTLDTPGAVVSVSFINEPLGCVDGYKINHFEQGLSSWEIRAHNEETGEEFSTMTDETGYFDFRLSLGTWTLSEVLQEGWTAVTASEFSVEVNQPFACEHVRFKNRTDYACVDVYKKDAYDNSGLPGWEITLQPTYGGTSQSHITDGTGWVRFNMLTPGSYTLAEVAQPGWEPVGPMTITMQLENTGSCSVAILYNRQSHQADYHHSDEPAPPPHPTPTDDEPTQCSQIYIVQRGDTMYRIARRHNTTWEEIQSANDLANPRVIHAGLELCIP